MSDDTTSDGDDEGVDSLQQIAEELDDPECTEYQPDESRYDDGEVFGYE